MKTSLKMQQFVTQICKKHCLDLGDPEARLMLEMPEVGFLIVSRGKGKLIHVAQMQRIDGALRSIPELVLFTTDEGLVPIELFHELRGIRICAEMDEACESMIRLLEGQAELANDADTLATQLTETGWLERGEPISSIGQPIQRDQPPDSDPPDIETLMAWMEEGGCEATDSCWVEPDGVCPHGHRSWLLELGLI